MQRDGCQARAVSLGASADSEEEDSDAEEGDSDSEAGDSVSEEEAADWEQQEQEQPQQEEQPQPQQHLDSGSNEDQRTDGVHVLLAALRHPKHRWKAAAATAADTVDASAY